MTDIRNQPESRAYLPKPTPTLWVKTSIDGKDAYRLEPAPILPSTAGRRNRGPASQQGLALATLSLLESGAVLASFPICGPLPGAIEPDPYSIWFSLNAPAYVPAGLFGHEIRIAAGKHLMTSCLGTWIVFFRPAFQEIFTGITMKSSQHASH